MSDNRVVGQLDFSGKRHIGVMLILLSAFLYSPVCWCANNRIS